MLIRSTNEVAVIIGTFGDDEWNDRGEQLLIDTSVQQTVRPLVVHYHHADSLQKARNGGAELAPETVEWLVFLDADDELDSHFVETLLEYEHDADILQTAVRGFTLNEDGWTREWLDPVPVLHRQKYPLKTTNYLIIGSPIRTDIFRSVGGFDDWPVLEDWAFFLKAYNAGAKFGELYDAVYFINDNHARNRHPDIDNVARKIRVTYR